MLSMGLTRNSLVPYVKAARPPRAYEMLTSRSIVISGGGLAGLRRNSGYVMTGGISRLDRVDETGETVAFEIDV